MAAKDLITAAQGYASTLLSGAQDAVSSAKQAIESVGYTVWGPVTVDMPPEPGTDIEIEIPEFTDVELEIPQDPGAAPTYQAISSIDAGYAPSLAAVRPVVTMPTKPNQLAAFTEAAPAINTNLEFPEPPSELSTPLGPAPTIVDRTEPTAPVVQLPAFTAIAPQLTETAPTGLDQVLASKYGAAAPQMISMINGYVDDMLTRYNPQYHTQMAALESQLTKYLQGGTGLNAAVEDAIYERSRSKQSAEANRVRDAAWGDAAARGFTLPTGALMSAVQTARQAAADNNAASAREIVVMQAEMEQKNLQFAVTTSANLRTTLLNATFMYMQNLTSINSQALDYAKSVVNALVETYNTAVKAFAAKLDAYKADAQVYEAKIRGALAVVELYKAEIDALQALVNVDRAKVEVYKARIDALQSYAQLYKAQVEAVLGRASLERLKMDLFGMKVQAYGAQVQAKNAEWQGYSASIEGETAKVRMYGAEVDAYGAQVTGYKAQIEAKSEVVRAQAMANQALSTQYAAKLQGYSALIAARGDVARTKLETQRTKLNAFQAQTQAAVASYQVRSEYYKSAAMVGIENAKLQMTNMTQNAQTMRDYGASLANLSSQLASVHGSMASAALSGMNSLAAETTTT